MTESAVTWSTEGGIHRIRLANPARHNSLVPESVVGLRAALAAGQSARVVLITSSGKHFSAGGDHAALEKLGEQEFSDYLVQLTTLFEDFAAYPLPIVAGVHGGAVGGGLQIALQCDFVVAAETSWFSLPQIAAGIPVSDMVYANLLARSSLGFVRRMILLGERVDSAAALAHGLVDEVVSVDDLERRATEIATILASRPRRSVAVARDALRRGFPRVEGITYARTYP